ncbi:MAG TPA: hypothetical protein VG056_02265 [Pirellulales bacterium]|jgi:hypothetical protein|nr:hypothetical protein [Pirellulales bacterium]
MAKYLLSCTCGRRIPVAAAQAGEQLQCECGQQVEVPTLRHLTSLERLDDSSARPQRAWGARQGLIFLGACLIAVAVGGLLVLQLQKPQPIQEPAANVDVAAMSPAEIWMQMDRLERGIKRQLSIEEAIRLRQHKIAMDYWELMRIAGLAVAGAGVLVVVIGSFIAPAKSRGKFKR